MNVWKCKLIFPTDTLQQKMVIFGDLNQKIQVCYMNHGRCTSLEIKLMDLLHLNMLEWSRFLCMVSVPTFGIQSTLDSQRNQRMDSDSVWCMFICSSGEFRQEFIVSQNTVDACLRHIQFVR